MMDHTGLVRNVGKSKTYAMNPKELSDKKITYCNQLHLSCVKTADYTPVAKMEEIKLILAYACSKRIKVYQMNVKSTFLNGEL
jgi:hypothetical protein